MDDYLAAGIILCLGLLALWAARIIGDSLTGESKQCLRARKRESKWLGRVE